MDHLILGVLASILAATVQAGETCTIDQTYHINYYSFEYKYCANNCCGAWPHEYCCSDDDDNSNAMMILIIVGCTVGGIIILSCIVTVICSVIKKKNHQGIIIHPSPGVAMVPTAYPGPTYGYQQPGMYQPPPAYHLPPLVQPTHQQSTEVPSSPEGQCPQAQIIDDPALPPIQRNESG